VELETGQESTGQIRTALNKSAPLGSSGGLACGLVEVASTQHQKGSIDPAGNQESGRDVPRRIRGMDLARFGRRR
jgi:hypothetical protein